MTVAVIVIIALGVLIALYGIKQSLLSHHMKKLTDAGLVTVERRHRWAYYSISADILKELTGWLS